MDHICSLNCILDLLFNQKKRLYCASVDYRKAFDTVDRPSLWSKVLKYNIAGKVMTVIRNMYNMAKSCVRLNSNLSEYFSCDVGLRQGENLSPLLFAIYLNDLQEHFTCVSKGITCTDREEETNVLLRLFTLLYANDTILLSESAEDLKKMLDILCDYCQQWRLTVNTEKTKIIVFSGGKVRKLPSLTLNNQLLEVQYSYTYLGILFNYNGKFKNAMQKQISQAKRALFSLLVKARKLQLPIDLQCHLFDACIVPILLYGCEIWGFNNLSEIEKVQNYFCKYILKLNTRTATCIALRELGRTTLKCIVQQRMINFWYKLSTRKLDKIASTLFQIIKEQQARGLITLPWLTFINKTLNECGLGYLLHTPPEALNPKHVKLIVRDRTTVIASQDWYSQVMESGHCLNYRIFKTDRQFENYLTLLHCKEALDLCRFRCGNHKLPITTGRYNQTEKSKRICPLCNSNKIGEEFHYHGLPKNFGDPRLFSLYLAICDHIVHS